MNANRNKTVERKAGIVLSEENFDAMLIDNRYGMYRNTTRESCGRLGLTAKKRDGLILVEGPRDRLQMLVEILHFSRIEFSVDH